MSKLLLAIPDQHAHPDHSNERADWLAKLIIDLQPDIVVNGGDAADMASLSSYDKGKRSSIGKSYTRDLNAHLEFQDRLWGPVKARKKKLPYRVVLEGNHEHRIERALDLSPEYENLLGFSDYDFDHYYQDVVRYDGETPGIIKVEGILFAHFFPTGISGRPVGGERPAHMLLNKHGTSSIQFHTHTLDFATRRTVEGRIINGIVGGCYQDYINDWAGNIGNFWRAGVVLLHNVENGNFDFQWISLEQLRAAYGEPRGGSEPRLTDDVHHSVEAVEVEEEDGEQGELFTS